MIAVTDSGKKVVLHENKTWEYLENQTLINSSNEYDFRNVSWGMDVSQIKASEKLKIELDDGEVLA